MTEDIDGSATRPGDHMVRCNSCDFTRLRSEPGGCPEGHRTGWSFAGPLPPAHADSEADELAYAIEATRSPRPGEPDEFSEGLEAEPEDGPTREEIEAVEAELARADPEPDDDRAAQIEEAVAEVCQAQMELGEAQRDEDEKARQKKAATQKVEAKQEWLNDASLRLRKLREGRFPDADRYPMFDRAAVAKDALDALFARPEAVQPLPPADYAEFCRREARDTRFDAVPGIKPATARALAEAGLVTVEDFKRKSDALFEANAPLTSIRGLTEKRLEEVTDALVALTTSWLERWAEMHPEAGEGAGDE